MKNLQSGEVTVVTRGGTADALKMRPTALSSGFTGTPSITIDGEQYDALRKFLLGCAQNERTQSHL